MSPTTEIPTTGTGLSLADLIQRSRENPPVPIIDGLLNEGEIGGIHGLPEAFKTTLGLHIAEAICTGKPLLERWTVPRPRSVYFFESEMSGDALGARLAKMFAGKRLPDNLHFASKEDIKRFRRAVNLAAKFALLAQWLRDRPADVVILDTCNPLFRGAEKPNDETAVGRFFDLLAELPCLARLFVRHNHRPREDESDSDGSLRIRGSGQFADVPDMLIEMRRRDKRLNQGELAVTKLRNDSKPDDIGVWFDKPYCRLIPGSPMEYLLREGKVTREKLLEALESRFSISPRMADAKLKENQALRAVQEGHKRAWELEGILSTP
jgi:hypothetical protein